MAEVRSNGENDAKKALITDDKITGLQNKVETLTDTVKKDTHRIVMTEESLQVVKKMQEEIEFLQKRMIDAYSLKELD